ncbi:Ribokinase-like protein [Boletus reticuloceps]|uniref:adenosine kinase n=1 Tax=Boletus reticuloceps TaxID=495285 RepID=A0A8I3AEQ3_9AGAM|nr:Ribokinase-like protein [Boletus reticuloceps]
MSYKIFCMGNPLLDVQVRDGEALLKKYDLKANDAILADEKHQPIYEEIVKDYPVTYVAGGASQNAARGAAYVLPPKSVVYAGCVGDDDLAKQLRTANEREGLDEVYLVKKGEKTGACAVIITGHHRSLVTTLRAAEKFEASHLSSPTVAPLVEGAKVFYVEGFFLTHGVESVLTLSKHASEKNKTFVLNLSAPFILTYFHPQLEQVLPYTDIIIGNESEAQEYAKAILKSDTTDIAEIAKGIAKYRKANARPRVVVITQGPQSTVVVDGANPNVAKVYPVTPIVNELIVDTNGAGDAFAGGFLGAYVDGKSIEESVEVGHKMGAIGILCIFTRMYHITSSPQHVALNNVDISLAQVFSTDELEECLRQPNGHVGPVALAGVHLPSIAFIMPYQLFCMGDPLLDVQVRDGEALLTKYHLSANNAIRAEDQHQPIYEEIATRYRATYVAGGGAQNAARGAAYVLPPKSVVFTGCVGDDDLAAQLRAANQREGLDEVYFVKKGERRVLVLSLVTTLRAAGKFEASHLSSPTVAPLVEGAKVYYVEGFFLTHGVESALALSKHASEYNKTFVLNLSAPFILAHYHPQLEQVLPYTDIILGNDSEAHAYAKAILKSDTTDIVEIAKGIVKYRKANARPRVVVITQGSQSTIVVDGANPDVAKVYPVTPIASELIVDTNGAGDAFAGGFLGAYVDGRGLEESVEVGHKMGAMCVQLVGPQYRWPKVKVL